MTAITASDFTDLFIKDYKYLETYIALFDTALKNLAAMRGLEASDISDPVHYLVKEWGINWVGKKICFDNKAKSSKALFESGGELENSYAEQYEDYRKEEEKARRLCTKEVLMDKADVPKKFAAKSISLVRS